MSDLYHISHLHSEKALPFPRPVLGSPFQVYIDLPQELNHVDECLSPYMKASSVGLSRLPSNTYSWNAASRVAFGSNFAGG
jgi:hypothetical protein